MDSNSSFDFRNEATKGCCFLPPVCNRNGLDDSKQIVRSFLALVIFALFLPLCHQSINLLVFPVFCFFFVLFFFTVDAMYLFPFY